MKLKSIVIISTLLVFIACKQGKENTSTIHCYRYASPTDTIALSVVHEGDSVTGNLVYNLSGKDKNTGTIQGKMHGDLLVANYTFNSEGMSSTREVAFKLTGGNFIEGYGEVDVQNNHVRFKDINALTFNDAFKLGVIPCP